METAKTLTNIGLAVIVIGFFITFFGIFSENKKMNLIGLSTIAGGLLFIIVSSLIKK